MQNLPDPCWEGAYCRKITSESAACRECTKLSGSASESTTSSHSDPPIGMWWIAIASTPRWVWVNNWVLLKVVAKNPVNLLSLSRVFWPLANNFWFNAPGFLVHPHVWSVWWLKTPCFNRSTSFPGNISFWPCKRPAQSGRHELPQARLSSHPLWAPNMSKISGLKTCWPRPL
jgi:hypothetical protein